ncbi:LysR substrate-binding domain-containing protein [soil metagenome]
MLDLRRLYYFSKVAQYGSFREASSREAIAQSALTRQVQRLERDLGVRLLSRGKAGATPTEAGYALLERVPAILASVADIQMTFKRYRRTPGGTATLALPISFATFLMPKLHGVFDGGFTNLQLRILEGSARHVEAWVLSGEADIGIVVLPCSSPLLSLEPLYEEDLFLIHQPSSTMSVAPTVDFRQLAGLPLVLPPLPHGTRELIEARARELGIKLSPVAEVDSPHTQKYMILNHGMIGVSSKMVYQNELAAGTIVATPVMPTLRRTFAIATQRRARLPTGPTLLLQVLRRSMPS